MATPHPAVAHHCCCLGLLVHQLIIPLFRDLPERFYPIAVTPALVAVGPDITQFQRVLGRIIQPLR